MSSKLTSGESEGSHRNKGVSQAGIWLSLTTKPSHNSRNRTCPQSVNCSERRLFGYNLLFCAFLRTK